MSEPQSTEPIELFYSYSHKDEKLREKLETHLAMLKRQGVIAGWHDRKIGAGQEWANQIDEHLNTAKIILLLVSADFLASDYCYDVEVSQAMARYEAGEAIVIPIILRPCDWHAAPFGKLQALPTDGKPVTEWANRDAAFGGVVLGIQRALPVMSRHSRSERRPSERATFLISVEASPDDIDTDKLLEIIRETVGDNSITIRKIEQGSVVLYLEGTKETADILEYLVKTEILKDVCGCKVKGVGLVLDKLAEPSADVPAIDEVDGIEGNRANLRRLISQIRTVLGIIPFVGAGLSISLGAPGWTEFLLIHAQATGVRLKVQKLLNHGLYEEAAEELENAITPFALRSAIEDKYGDHNFDLNNIRGAITWLPRLCQGPVITTNFDRLLEHVFEKYNSRFEQVVLGAKPDMVNIALMQNRRRLLKLHGDWEEATERILTKTEYEKHYGSAGSTVDFSLPLPRLLKQILTGRSLLFVGCSLNQDRTIQVLRQVADEATEIEHFAVVEYPPTEAKYRNKIKFLSKHNIHPIWYPYGRHEYVQSILAFLVDKRAPKV